MREFPLIDFDAFHRAELPTRLAAAIERGVAADLRGVPGLAFVVPGHRSYTYLPQDGLLAIEAGTERAAAVVELSLRAWSDLVQDVRTVPALIYAGDVHLARGEIALLRRWQPALRALYGDVPIYDPARVDLTDRRGRPLDLRRSFSLEEPPEESSHFFHRAGFLHLRGVFSAGEIAALRAVVDELQAAARPGDDRSWWAKDAGGRQVLCRLVYTGLAAPHIAALIDEPRLRQIVSLTGFDLRPVLDRQEGQSVVIKNPSIVEGLADLPWHQDCGLGGHPITCPAVAIGIQLEAATAESGQLHFLAGTHGSSCHPFAATDLATLPHVALNTAPGDCTLHIKDVMHAAPPPTGIGRGRRTLYVSFLSPRAFEYIGPGEAYNDIVRRSGDDGHVAHTREILSSRAQD
jgi:Phytanoyl-CoA dioxygenase (PhyH)